MGEVTLTPGEKLILLMLCDLHKHHKVKSETDPDFVRDAILEGHLWALGWEYTGIFGGDDTDEEVVSEVGEIMTMWRVLEDSFNALAAADQAKVLEAIDPWPEVKFRGFDGNNESTHMSAAGFMINKLDRFAEFKGRDLNAHMPTLDAHRRMLGEFNPIMRRGIGHGRLSSADVIKIIRAVINPENR